MHVGQLHLPHENKAPHTEEEAGVRLASETLYSHVI